MSAEKAPKRPPERPKTTPKRPQNGQKSDPERQDDKRTEPRRFQDRLGPVQGAGASLSAHPRGSFGSQIGTKAEPKRSQNEAKIQESTKTDPRRSWTQLGAILGRLEHHLGPTWTSKLHSRPRWRSFFGKNHFFDVKTVRGRLWNQLWPTEAPKRPKMSPKTEPKSTPRRSQIDVKIANKNMPKPRGLKSFWPCLLYTSPSPRDGLLSRMPSSA